MIGALPQGGLLAFSYNDATLADSDYMEALARALQRTELAHESYGAHLPGKDMSSSVYILRKP